ncbi:MAG: SDR family oxidoreductase [Vitreimonas sp.]
MRVFVTGASGFVGSAIVPELIAGGHTVVGLARSDASAAAIEALGADVVRGSLEDLDVLRDAAARSDGVTHCAFVHDFANYAESGQIDKRAIEALAAGLAGSNKPLIVTSGTALLAPGRLALEDDAAPDGFPRASEQAGFATLAHGVRAMAIRLSPSVHGEGDHGFVPRLIAIAREKGASAYVGEGLNRWSGVHRLDAAKLYRLALERGVAGARYHGVADEGVPFKEIAAVIGRHLNIPVVSKSPAEAAEHFGWFAMFAAIDAPTSNALTRERLAWTPTEPGLLEDLDQGHYFET